MYLRRSIPTLLETMFSLCMVDMVRQYANWNMQHISLYVGSRRMGDHEPVEHSRTPDISAVIQSYTFATFAGLFIFLNDLL